ncbi:MAG TPA: hypothetical protein VG319_02500, partial [Polyangia bacterium]|nr:hypothetical protein [Polyangia bacterium]
MGTRALLVFSAALLAASAVPAAAAPDEPDAANAANATTTPGEVDDFLAKYAPAPVEGPELRLPVSPTRVWLDLGYARTDDLSSLPYITGRAWNVRVAAGATWRWRRFAFTGEIPFPQV